MHTRELYIGQLIHGAKVYTHAHPLIQYTHAQCLFYRVNRKTQFNDRETGFFDRETGFFELTLISIEKPSLTIVKLGFSLSEVISL